MAGCAPMALYLSYRPNKNDDDDDDDEDGDASNKYDVLRRLYHEKEACGYNLRTRHHNFALSVKDDNNFVSRSLYAELKT